MTLLKCTFRMPESDKSWASTWCNSGKESCHPSGIHYYYRHPSPLPRNFIHEFVEGVGSSDLRWRWAQ
eukprot:3320915-Lingulodinium_polyedra.AAC.1